MKKMKYINIAKVLLLSCMGHRTKRFFSDWRK